MSRTKRLTFGYCLSERETRADKNSQSRQGPAENTFRKSNPIRFISDLLCRLADQGQARPKDIADGCAFCGWTKCSEEQYQMASVLEMSVPARAANRIGQAVVTV